MNTIDRAAVAAVVTPVVYRSVRQGLEQVGSQIAATAEAAQGDVHNHIAAVRNQFSQLGRTIDTLV